MKGFGFSLPADTRLGQDAAGYFLLSPSPLRVLRLNEPLFRLLRHIREGGDLSEFVKQHPPLQEGRLLNTLLSLSSKGYLELENIAEVPDYPRVSVIIPVRDQPDDLMACLKSLANLNYPRDRLEIIVVDDGSRPEISQAIASPGTRVIRQAESKGASACRNAGAASARGDILAFLDADCMAGEDWLKEIVPFFRVASVGAVGGYVDGYYGKSFLDRYEKAASSLNLGRRLLLEGNTGSSFYVPTANMLVTREAFTASGGFKEGMHLGEDVDFCWRMRKLGYTLLYVPFGRVAHKHRNRLCRMLRRRGDYGTSEAVLYSSHRDKKKLFFVSVYTGLAFLSLTLSILLMSPYPVGLIPLLFGIDLLGKSATMKRLKMTIPFLKLVNSTLRSYFSLGYFAFFHLVRYYLVPILALGFWLHSLWFFGGLALLYTSLVDYCVKKPDLPYPVFLFYYTLEHIAYQSGVFRGCLKRGYFRSYFVSFRRL